MRRRLVIVVVFLLAGAVVNVAVAWGCALLHGNDATIVWELGAYSLPLEYASASNRF